MTLEEKFNMSAQENDSLRRGVNESNFHKTQMTQDFEQKMRMLTQNNEELDRKCHDYDTKLSYASK